MTAPSTPRTSAHVVAFTKYYDIYFLQPPFTSDLLCFAIPVSFTPTGSDSTLFLYFPTHGACGPLAAFPSYIHSCLPPLGPRSFVIQFPVICHVHLQAVTAPSTLRRRRCLHQQLDLCVLIMLTASEVLPLLYFPPHLGSDSTIHTWTCTSVTASTS